MSVDTYFLRVIGRSYWILGTIALKKSAGLGAIEEMAAAKDEVRVDVVFDEMETSIRVLRDDGAANELEAKEIERRPDSKMEYILSGGNLGKALAQPQFKCSEASPQSCYIAI